MINLYPTWLNTSLVYPQFLEFFVTPVDAPEVINLLSSILKEYEIQSSTKTNYGIASYFIKGITISVEGNLKNHTIFANSKSKKSITLLSKIIKEIDE